jgi:hypothetical protein
MTRAQLEHVIRAARTIADDSDLIIIGSQAILGQFPDAPHELLVSVEADVYPRHHPERAELVEGAIGELSMFHETSATTPMGWPSRRRPFRAGGMDDWWRSGGRARPATPAGRSRRTTC